MIDFQRIEDIAGIKVEIIGKDYIPLHRSNYNILAGTGGVGKSLIALKILIHFLVEKPKEQALAIFSEDTKSQIEERIDFIVRGLDITKEEVYARTFFKTLDNDDGEIFAHLDGRTPILNMEYFMNFTNSVLTQNVGLIILDPMERFHTGLSENNESDMKFLVSNVFQKIGTATGAAVLVLHHTAKGNVSGARGSGVITNKGRVAYNIRRNMVMDDELGVEKIRKGWEKSVILTTIKDNHFIERWCDAISQKNGRLELPVKELPDYAVEVYEATYEMPDPDPAPPKDTPW